MLVSFFHPSRSGFSRIGAAGRAARVGELFRNLEPHFEETWRRNRTRLGRPAARQGFTLVELLVVIAIIGILVALLLPAIQAAREAARRSACQNNIKQIAVAMHNYESSNKAFPPSLYFYGTGDARNSNWSAQARILPYLEEGVLESAIDYTQSYNTVRVNGDLVSSKSVPVFRCPSEQRTEPKVSANEVTHIPINYGVNCGVWFVFDSATLRGGDGMFFPNSVIRFRNCTDGTSKTLLVSELKTYQTFDTGSGKGVATPVDEPSDICGLLSGTFKETAHTEWVDGKVHETGFTAAMPPNEPVLCMAADIDWINSPEGKNASTPTYAAVTSRSYHSGGVVNAAMVDGSIRAVSRDIDILVWRAMATRGGEESVDVPGH
jgi:prepilin-type N-terminal cleavage/methylation domain-containing protein/prepilin-type processing-associated H-X9-DG protein